MELLGFSIFTWFIGVIRGASAAITSDILFYIVVGLEVALVFYFAIKSRFSYERRLLRALDRINIYLLSNTYVTENNLIEFNKKMKAVPKTLRYHWQQYMLYRENLPSYYMSTNNVIEKPLKSSSLTSNLKVMKYLSFLLIAVSFVFIFAGFAFPPGDITSFSTLAQVVVYSIAIPLLVFVIYIFFNMFSALRQSANVSELYQTFHIYQRLMDKATTTIPDYVDFEVLFTKKEIKKGIPVLNEYLEKRARLEQEELEKARLNAVEHENYDFTSVDINGALILERSMKETEIYLNLRQRLLAEIQQTESEIDTLKKTNDNAQKDYQRKMQASKENLERLRLQQESTTNRIESNYIRKQVSDEIKKQQQIEKDNDDATMRFTQELSTLEQAITKIKAELDEQKQYIQKAMVSEYQSYATKVYKGLAKMADQKEKETKESLQTSRDKYAQETVDLKEQVEESEKEIESLKAQLRSLGVELAGTVAKTRISKANKEPEYDEYGGYYDDKGYYRYKNGTYYDPEGNYYDETGGHYDAEGNYYPADQSEVKTEEESPVEAQAEAPQAEKPVEVVAPVEIESAPTPVEVSEEKPVAEIQEQPKIEEAPAKPQAKRGRPRKEKVEQKPKAPGKRGRPKKVVSESEKAEPKKPRGRPKKETTEVKPKPAGKRGRPKKEPVAAKPKTAPKKTEEKVAKPKIEPKNTEDEVTKPKAISTEVEVKAEPAPQIPTVEVPKDESLDDIDKSLNELLDSLKDIGETGDDNK